MHDKSNQVVLELKKTGLRVLNEVELLSIGSGVVNAGQETATETGPIDTDITSVSTRNVSGG